jgi:SNF2 family DNA or RNA helicase
MGLGKTIQTIAVRFDPYVRSVIRLDLHFLAAVVQFMLAIMPPHDASTDADWLTGNHLLSPKKAPTDPKKPAHQPIAIVVPGSVLHNWKKEISAWYKIADRKYKLLLHHGGSRKSTQRHHRSQTISSLRIFCVQVPKSYLRSTILF